MTGGNYHEVAENGFQSIFVVAGSPVPHVGTNLNLLQRYNFYANALFYLLSDELYPFARILMDLHMDYKIPGKRVFALIYIIREACAKQPGCDWTRDCAGPIQTILFRYPFLDKLINPYFVHELGELGVVMKILDMDDARFRVSIIFSNSYFNWMGVRRNALSIFSLILNLMESAIHFSL